MNHLYIAGTIFFTVFGQLIGKWRISSYNQQIPKSLGEKILFFATTLVVDPFIILSYTSAFVASFFWLMAVSKFELSYAYPFMSLAFVLVFICSALLFGETFSPGKILGTSLIIAGLIILAKSKCVAQ